MDKLEWAVDTVDGTTFEKIAGELLRHEGYDVHESGVIGADGGWDARIEIDSQKGIGHASVRNDWRVKLREDAKKVETLEDKQDMSFDLLVFVTNQHVSGQQEINITNEIEQEYGWDLKILHRRDVIGITGNERPDLAERHFGFNPKREDDHIEQIIELRDDRLDTISNREGVAKDLVNGPVMVIHIIPNGVFSGNYVDRSDEIPDLAGVGQLNRSHATETTGKGKLFAHSTIGQPYQEYTYLRKDGLFEANDTWVFQQNREGNLVIENSRNKKESLDCKVGITVQAGIRELKDMGVTGTAFFFISLINAEGVKFAYDDVHGPAYQQPLRTSNYTTEVVEIPLEQADVVDAIEPPLREIWQELGWEQSIHYDENGNWIGPTIRFADIGQFPASTDE